MPVAKTPVPMTKILNTPTPAMKELSNLVSNPTIDFSRKQMMSFKGQPYHARYLSCDVSFVDTDSVLDHDQHVLQKTGWGTNVKAFQ